MDGAPLFTSAPDTHDTLMTRAAFRPQALPLGVSAVEACKAFRPPRAGSEFSGVRAATRSAAGERIRSSLRKTCSCFIITSQLLRACRSKAARWPRTVKSYQEIRYLDLSRSYATVGLNGRMQRLKMGKKMGTPAPVSVMTMMCAMKTANASSTGVGIC